MTTARAYAAPSKGAALEPTTIERRALRDHDVQVTILFSGICHSDIHQARGEWGGSNFPMVPGHEITGVVEAVGPQVTKFAVGDRVGVGVIVDSCRDCVNCDAGLEQYCISGATGTYNVKGRDGEITQGGYSSSIVADDRFVHRIPDSLPLDAAAPLLCAGITVYSPLKHWGAGPGKEVAVVGMGGLGHMAVQFAHALGARVTVLSQSLSKKEDGLRLGADEYYATSDRETFKSLRGRFDIMVNTVSAPLDINQHLALLRTDGVLVNVGLPVEPLSVGVFPLIQGRKSIAGSSIGGMPETQEMLDFCGEKGIGAQIEVIPASQINEAYERVDRSDVRFRFVIDGSTF